MVGGKFAILYSGKQEESPLGDDDDFSASQDITVGGLALRGSMLTEGLRLLVPSSRYVCHAAKDIVVSFYACWGLGALLVDSFSEFGM